MATAMERTTEEDSVLFEKLDGYSIDLRSAAAALSAVLKQVEHPPKEISTMIEILGKIKTTPIEDLDDMIMAFNESTSLATIKINKEMTLGKEFMSQSLFGEFLEKSDHFAGEALKLTRKAIELNTK